MTSSFETEYKIVSQVGLGTYGKVFKATHTSTGELLALKKLRMETEKEGFPVTAVREIKLLKRMKHKNIIQLKEISTDERTGAVYLVYAYMPFDLAGLLHHFRVSNQSTTPVLMACLTITAFSFLFHVEFSSDQIASLCAQLVQGLYYLHMNGIAHRDLKASNLLLDQRGNLQVADFGLAKHYIDLETDDICAERLYPNGFKSTCLPVPPPTSAPPALPSSIKIRPSMTNRVCTIWYRSPELLCGSTAYGPEIDVWSLGCLIAEFFIGRPLFPGSDEKDQAGLVLSKVTSGQDLEYLKTLPWAEALSGLLRNDHGTNTTIEGMLPTDMPSSAKDLCLECLQFRPWKRISAQDARAHPFVAPLIDKANGAGEARVMEESFETLFASIQEMHEYEFKQQSKSATASLSRKL